jgi:hypothetical protein
LSGILEGTDELVNKKEPGRWYLAGAGRSGWWAVRGQWTGGYEDAWERAWLFSWKGGVGAFLWQEVLLLSLYHKEQTSFHVGERRQ